jgi:hypothetical protein
VRLVLRLLRLHIVQHSGCGVPTITNWLHSTFFVALASQILQSRCLIQIMSCHPAFTLRIIAKYAKTTDNNMATCCITTLWGSVSDYTTNDSRSFQPGNADHTTHRLRP